MVRQKENPRITAAVMEQVNRLKVTHKVDMKDMYALYTYTGSHEGYEDLHAIVAEDLNTGTRTYIEILVRYKHYAHKFRHKF